MYYILHLAPHFQFLCPKCKYLFVKIVKIETHSRRSVVTNPANYPGVQGRAFEEARYNLATRVMSNGVEVIVAGDKSTLPGEPDIKRVLPSTIYKPITLKPSTLSDHMMMMLPQDASNVSCCQQTDLTVIETVPD